MRTIVTGTVGVDKKVYLEKVIRQAQAAGHDVALCNVGDRMYAEAPDITPGRILDLPITRLSALRRSVFKDIHQVARQHEHLIVNTHATFRWRHGLFPAFDFDQLTPLDADLFICLMDTADALHARLARDHQLDHSLKDLLVWREEEALATEVMMMGCNWYRQGQRPAQTDDDPPKSARFYILAVGLEHATTEMFYRLMFRPQLPKAYLSFPITHVADMPTVLADIDRFRKTISEHLIVFDPADLEEFPLYQSAVSAVERGHKVVECEVLGRQLHFDVSEVLQAAGDIHGQIYARDFKLIDQADMIVSYIPELPGGKPGLSSGVERELQHAHEAAKDVYVIWQPKASPSPFVTETATRIFPDVDTAVEYFESIGYVKLPRRKDGMLFG